jgi:hypothetical protein
MACSIEAMTADASPSPTAGRPRRSLTRIVPSSSLAASGGRTAGISSDFSAISA